MKSYHCTPSPSLAKMIYTTSGIPTRLYRGGELIAMFFTVSFTPDPVASHLIEIRSQPEPVNLYVTKYLQFFGSVKCGDDMIILGPIGKIPLDDATLTEILFELGQSRERVQELREFFSTIPSHFEIVRFAQILCDINSCVNGTQIEPTEIALFNFDSAESVSKSIYENLQRDTGDEFDEARDPSLIPASVRQAYEYEKNLLFAISHGKADHIKEMINHSVQVGRLADDNTRQIKNQSICSAVLASRAAINGGLDVRTAYALCDIYIQRIERARSFSELSAISSQILIDYATRVNELSYGEETSPIISRAIQYIAHNINQRIYADDIADALNINRPYLSSKFKKETGLTLTDYITQQKIVEAQRLIRYTDKSLSEISNYLDFSSQSYFQRQFKKFTGMTPYQFKKKSESDT